MKKLIIIMVVLMAMIFSGCEQTPISQTPPKSDPLSPCPTQESHTDVNNDGLCDSCKVSVVVTVDFYGLNDMHGKFTDSSNNIGVDELTTYLLTSYIADKNSVTLSSGDMWQGGSESNLTEGLIITEWMNYIGVTAMTLGNHEFDWGVEAIEKNAKLAEFPFLAINIYERDTNKLADYCTPSVIVERGGIEIGIIGAIGDCYTSIASENVEDVYFKTGSQLTDLIKDESERLRDEGADYIVLSFHEGYNKSGSGVSNVSGNQITYYDSELSEGGYVDLVFEGHTHKSYVLRDTYGVYHLQDGGDNRGISHVEVNINFANSKHTVNVAEFVDESIYENLPDNKIVDELCEKYKDVISKGETVLGYNSSYRDYDELAQFVADLYYEKGIEWWGDEYDIVLGGGFIKPRSPYKLETGIVKYSQLMSVFPFDNEIVLCSLSGRDLKEKFINHRENYRVKYEQGLAASIDDNATYYIVTDSYTSTYRYNNLTEIERYDSVTFARDLLAEYIQNGGLEG